MINHDISGFENNVEPKQLANRGHAAFHSAHDLKTESQLGLKLGRSAEIKVSSVIMANIKSFPWILIISFYIVFIAPATTVMCHK